MGEILAARDTEKAEREAKGKPYAPEAVRHLAWSNNRQLLAVRIANWSRKIKNLLQGGLCA